MGGLAAVFTLPVSIVAVLIGLLAWWRPRPSRWQAECGGERGALLAVQAEGMGVLVLQIYQLFVGKWRSMQLQVMPFFPSHYYIGALVFLSEIITSSVLPPILIGYEPGAGHLSFLANYR